MQRLIYWGLLLVYDGLDSRRNVPCGWGSRSEETPHKWVIFFFFHLLVVFFYFRFFSAGRGWFYLVV